MGEIQFDILGQVFNEFIALRLMGVDDQPNTVVEQKEVGVDMECGLILCQADIPLDLLDGRKIIRGVHQPGSNPPQTE